MSEIRPPTRFVRIMCWFIGAAVFAPALWQQFGKVGAAAGVLIGVALGQLLNKWVQRTFLEF